MELKLGLNKEFVYSNIGMEVILIDNLQFFFRLFINLYGTKKVLMGTETVSHFGTRNTMKE